MDLSRFPSSEAEFRTQFADDNRCREYLARLKWPEGFRCAHCAGDRAYFLPSKRVVYECAGCRRQVSIIAGMIFEQSKKPLVLWFRALFEITASKQGISAAELQRKLGLGSYQTAWSWLTKIRTAMVRPNREPLSGEVEIDESYVGGPEPGQPGRAAEDKAIVAAAVEKRGKSCGRVRLGVIANVSADVLTAFVDNHLGDGETAHTDGWRGYAQLGKTGYRHIISVLSKLDQTAAEVLPRVHLIFSLLKRWILGTHQGSVSLKHLDGYLEEFTFRFNRRRARRITHGAERLLGIAMTTPPRPFWKIVGRPRLQGKARLAVAA
jgi:transposase-like protein